jgi:hypothetical protein
MSKINDIKFGATVSHQGVNPSVSLSKLDFDWLIEEAEKYKNASKKIKKLTTNLNIVSNQRNELKKELKKYDPNRT